MDDQHLFSDIQMVNLTALLALHGCVLRDPVSACFAFRLTAAQLERLQRLVSADIAPLVASLRHVSLFRLREDFDALLGAPVALRPLFATLSDPVPSAWTPAMADRRTSPPVST